LPIYEIVSTLLNGLCMLTSGFNALQLGLDQMPDVSGSNITSFIAWFIFSSIYGCLISKITLHFIHSITIPIQSREDIYEALSVVPSLCLCIYNI